MLSRRTLLASASLALPGLLRARAPIKVGVCDWNLKKAATSSAVEMAASIGFDGLEVSLGRTISDGLLPLDSAVLQSRYTAEARDHKVTLTSTCLDVLHVHYMKLDPLGAKFTSDGIRISRAMGAPLMLLPFFGKGALGNREEIVRVADTLKELTGEAERAHIVLALENTLSAENNAFLLDRIGSDYVKVYYDVANSHYNGFDAPKEIAWLGKQRVGHVHFKERGYLGSGAVPLRACVAALHAIGYEGFINLELPSPSGDIAADMRRNLEFTRRMVAG